MGNMIKLKGALNPLPTLTWNFLKLNQVDVDWDIDLNRRGDMIIQNIPRGVSVKMNGGILDNVSGAAGSLTTELMEKEKVETLGIRVEAGVCAEVPLKLNYVLGEGDGMLRRQEIVAYEGSEVTVAMDYTAGRTESGFFGIQTKLLAKKGSIIRLIKTNLLGDKYLHFEDIAGIAEDGARIELIEMELGGGKNYIGTGIELSGAKSSFVGNVGYLCRGQKIMDMNYLVRHTGRKSESSFKLRGAMRDSSIKNFRGTIDFRRGAKGAKGDEQEESILLSRDVRNKTLPIILCDEEDVEGTHGANIGRLSEDVLFYMGSRGIEKSEVEALMTKAKLDSVRRLISDQVTQGRIQQFMEEALDHA
ncbi:MAG: SufD family Fe-S cluster assembly protein [Lachnospiraceae bacterium]|nr:SufD family Fe-S cluster assembly protein [Lachnospiraceae bacterium]